MTQDLIRPPGRFITIEGGEGAGKSTQARLLAEWLAGSGVAVLRTREPGGAPGAEVLRRLLLSGEVKFSPAAEMLLHFAARAEHVACSIRPALATGMWVVCDRFFDSTMAYQGYALGADRDDVTKLSRMLGVMPDLTIMLDVSVATTLQRLAARGGKADRYERLGPAFFAAAAAGFRAVAMNNPERCYSVNAEQDVIVVLKEVIAAICARFPDAVPCR
jgi:dTMP kinase